MQKIKKNWKKIFVTICILLLCVALVLRIITPNKPRELPSIPETKSPSIKKSDFSGVSITYPEKMPEVPLQLSVFDVAATPINLALLAGQLGLSSKDNGVHWYSAEGATLSQDPYSKRVGFSYINPTKSSKGVVNKDLAKTTAESFVKNILGLTLLNPVEKSIKLRQSEFEDNFAVPGQEDIAEIPFHYSFAGQEIYGDSDLFSPLIVSVSSENKVVGFTMTPVLIQSIKQEVKVKTVPLEKIGNQLLSNNVGVLQISSETPDGFQISSLKSLSIENIVIEYRLNSQTNKVLPYFHLSAKAINAEDSRISLQLITPAIQTTPQ